MCNSRVKVASLFNIYYIMTEESLSVNNVLDHEYSPNEKSRENLNKTNIYHRSRSPSNYSSSSDYHRRYHYRRDRQPNRYHNEYGRKQRYENRLDTRKRSKSPQLTEEQRDRRTVFVQQLAARLTEHELESFMERVGKVRKVKIVADKITGRSRG